MFEFYFAAISKFLAASLLIERLLEYFDQIFRFFGYASGNSKMLIRLSGKHLNAKEEEKRLLTKVFIMQSLGVTAGVVISLTTRLGIARELGLVSTDTLYWWDVLLSAFLISGGTEPIHNLLNFLKSKKDDLKELRIKESKKVDIIEIPKKQVRSALNRKFPLIGLDYKGGLYPKIPGHSLRKINPRYIVIHHSSTHENATFKEIVEIEKTERSNAQGSYKLDPSYHSVITNNGKNHNYCRWDSVGWHVAKGPRTSNSNSLGICFVGNFENRKNVKNHNTWNPKPRPSEEQLETGARVIALWRYLYDIPEAAVIPHRFVKPRHTVCPGNFFPVDRLVAKSSQILNEWNNSKAVQAELNRFKELDYLYI